VGGIAASVVLVLVQLALTELRTAASVDQLSRARDAARFTVERYVADLTADRNRWLTEVDVAERARVCIAQPGAPVFQPGSPWPTECGPVWTYTAAADPANVRLEVTPPGPGRDRLSVVAVAQVGETTAAYRAELRRAQVGAWTAVTESDLVLDRLASVNGGVVDVSAASFYSAGKIEVGTALRPTGSVLAAEDGFSPAVPAGGQNRFYSPGGVAPERELRTIVPAPRRFATLRAAADEAVDTACPGVDPFNIVDRSGLNRSLHLCVRQGAVLRNRSGGTVTVPTGVTAYRFAPTQVLGQSAVQVWASTRRSDAPTTGDVWAASAPALTAGEHPGGGGFWNVDLGTFWLPTTGVVAFDADVHVGFCGDGFATGSCVDHDPSAPGVNGHPFRESFTVVAGSAVVPRNVWISGSVENRGGVLGAVAFGDLIVGYWAAPAAGPVHVDGVFVALGSASGVDPEASVYSFPTTAPSGVGPASRTTFRGSLAAPTIDLDRVVTTAEAVLVPGVRPDANLPPWFPSFDPRWTVAERAPVPAVDACGGPCDHWTGASGPVDVSHSVTVTDDWGSGYCADVVVATTSEEPVSWTVEVSLAEAPVNGTPYTVWGASWSVTGTVLRASGTPTNPTVVAGSPVTWGFCANR
jgi:hypothetical protein